MADYKGMVEHQQKQEQAKKVLLGLNHALAQVREFHEVFGHPAPDAPVALDEKRRVFRHTILSEEVNEFLDAGTLIDQIDANIDTIWIALGNLVEMGIKDAQSYQDIVYEANMAKLGPDGKPIYRGDGKILKPEGWQPPEPKLALELERQIKLVEGK